MSLSCLLHGHQIIRYDRELAWECMRCLKKWPMAKELVSPSGVFARRSFAPVGTPALKPAARIQEFWPPKGRPKIRPVDRVA